MQFPNASPPTKKECREIMSVKKIGKRIIKGLKRLSPYKTEFITMAAVIIPALLIQDTSFASNATATTGATFYTGISALDKPISVLSNSLTGPIPKIGSTIAIAVGGLSWALGIEQQIIKFATRAAAGGGIAVGGGTIVKDFFDVSETASSCLF